MFALPSDIAGCFSDQSFPLALELASRLGTPLEPPWLTSSTECVRLVQELQQRTVPKFVQAEPIPFDQFQVRFDAAFTESANDPDSCPSVSSTVDRKNVLLRLWAGCVWSGKLIALDTRDGPTSSEMRAWFFREIVEPRAQICPVYRAGVVNAYAWKRSFEQPQPVCFDGVPEGYVVRMQYDAERA